jgi:hypothetical protein
MDTGKILIGFAFIILSVALMASPSNAEMQDLHADIVYVHAAHPGQIQGQSVVLFELPVPAGTGQDTEFIANYEKLP